MSKSWPGRRHEQADEEAEREEPQLEAVAAESEEHEHAAGDIDVPDDVDVLEGDVGPTRRQVAIVVSKFNGEITTKLLTSALDELERIGVDRDRLTIVPVPGAFELQLAALETGVPVAFGVLTLENAGQAEARAGKGAEAVRTALEMADLFTQLRQTAAAQS